MSRPIQTSTMTKKASDIMNRRLIASAHQPRETNEYDEWPLEKLTCTLKEKYGDGFPMDEESLAAATHDDREMVDAFFRKNNIVF